MSRQRIAQQDNIIDCLFNFITAYILFSDRILKRSPGGLPALPGLEAEVTLSSGGLNDNKSTNLSMVRT
jgi:hypothetical protein